MVGNWRTNMQIKLFAQDKANHYFYGSLAAALGAMLGIASCTGMALAVGSHASLLCQLVSGLMGAPAAAYLLGAWKESRDAADNAAAVAAGRPVEHSVDRADAMATLAGCVPVVAVLAALLVASRF
jgi:hypothetical protein